MSSLFLDTEVVLKQMSYPNGGYNKCLSFTYKRPRHTR